MKDELAARLLARVMEWDDPQFREHGDAFQRLARHKYDEYEGFSPGEKFLESLASWLWQLDNLEERRYAASFVRERLIFISRAELDHVIELVYPDVIRPLLRARAGADLRIPTYQVRRITESSEFRALQRKTVILGLADGARLDRLRRASPDLSHEQFSLVPDLQDDVIAEMQQKLDGALHQLDLEGPSVFRHAILVDDFSGTGFTLIRREHGEWKGKLPDAHRNVDRLKVSGALAADASVTIILYVASELAEQNVRQRLVESGFGWELRVVQRIPNSSRVPEGPFADLCKKYYDPILNDIHKGSAPLGFQEAALPLILSHNTPNDSLCLLWGDTTQREGSLRRHALFPRYERHHVERP
jgi:hypothetical protein